MRPGSRRWFLEGSIAVGAAAMFGCVPGGNGARREDGSAVGPDAAERDTGVGAARTDASGVDAAAPRPDASPHDAGEAGRPDATQVDAGHADVGQPDSGVDPAQCADPFAGGEYLGEVGFSGEGGSAMDRPFGSGLDGRLYTDLTNLDPNDLITPNDRFYIRTRYPDRLDPNAPWRVRVHGRVTRELELAMSDLLPRVRDMGTVLLECSGNGSFAGFGMLSAAAWRGLPLMEVVDMAGRGAGATRVLVSGFDQHSQPSARSTAGASWIFTFDDLATYGGFLATHMNGVELPRDHGYPLRLVMPRWFGCTCIKWVNEIELVDDSAASTSQMREFASRTHQRGTPTLARDFQPATMDQAAMPVRIEKWRVGGRVTYRVVGVMWGGYELTGALQVRFGSGGRWDPVDVCPRQATNDTWTVWSHRWTPSAPGTYSIRCRIDDPMIRTRRLDSGFYDRSVQIAEV